MSFHRVYKLKQQCFFWKTVLQVLAGVWRFGDAQAFPGFSDADAAWIANGGFKQQGEPGNAMVKTDFLRICHAEITWFGELSNLQPLRGAGATTKTACF